MTYRSLFLPFALILSVSVVKSAFADWQTPLIVKKSETYLDYNQQTPFIDGQRNVSVLWTYGSEFRQSRYDLRFAGSPHVWSEGPLGNVSEPAPALVNMDANGHVFALWKDGQSMVANYFLPDEGWHQEVPLPGIGAESSLISSGITPQNEIFVAWPLIGDNEAKEYRIYSSRYTAARGWEVVQEIGRNPLNVSQTIRPKLAVNANRQAIAAWEEVEFDESAQQLLGQIWVSLFNPATNQWSAPAKIKSGLTHISTSTAPISVTMDGSGNAFVFYDLYAAYCQSCVTAGVWAETQLADAGPVYGDMTPPAFRYGFDGQNNVVAIWEEQVVVGDASLLRLFSRRFDAQTHRWSGKVRLDTDPTHSVENVSSTAVLSVLKNGNALVSWVQQRTLLSAGDVFSLWSKAFVGGAWQSAKTLENGTDAFLRSAVAATGDKVALTWVQSDGSTGTLRAKVLGANLADVATKDIAYGLAGDNPNPVLAAAVVSNQDDFVLTWRDEVDEPNPINGGSRTRGQIRAAVYQGSYAAPTVPTCDGTPAPITALTNSSVSGADPSTMQYSREFTVADLGEGCLTQISIDRGAYSKNAGDYVSTPGYVKNGDRVKVRLQSPLDYGDGVKPQTLTARLLVGDVADYFSVSNKLAPSSTGGDSSPDPFSINPLNNVAPLSEAISESIFITGINTTTAVSVENGLIQIGESDWLSGTAYLTPTDHVVPAIRVKVVASENYGTAKVATLHVGNETAEFVVTTRPSEANSNAQPQPEKKISYAQLSTPYVAAWTMTGLTSSGVLTVSNGEFAINDGVFSSAAKVVNNDDVVTLRHISASTFSTSSSSSLMLGALTWAKITSETGPEDSTPEPFSLNFKQTNDIAPGATINSYVIVVEGINMPAPISVTNASYSINGGAFTSEPGTVSFQDMVIVRVTMPNAAASSLVPSVSIGGVARSVELKTKSATTGGTGTGDGDGRSVTGSNPVGGGGGGGGSLSWAVGLLSILLLRRRSLI
ncbi:MAG TPA: hypothetical protein VFM46_02615 [Pseudomonadales bacterium]|nr:hypothetical protein [Pseudomonadales bacterium]